MIWINSEILDLSPIPLRSTILSTDEWKRPYQLVEHAEKILSSPTTEFHRVDVITTLRRAIGHRVRQIDKAYSLRQIPLKNKPTDFLELLEFLGIIRPKMLRQIIEIRNVVEHEVASPPGHKECETYLEFAWYFLRSTDLIVQRALDHVQFGGEEEDEPYWLEVNVEPPEIWVPKIRGYVPGDFVSENAIEGWISLVPTTVETVEEKQSRAAFDEGVAIFDRKRKLDDTYLSGEIRGPESVLKRFYQVYFRLT